MFLCATQKHDFCKAQLLAAWQDLTFQTQRKQIAVWNSRQQAFKTLYLKIINSGNTLCLTPATVSSSLRVITVLCSPLLAKSQAKRGKIEEKLIANPHLFVWVHVTVLAFVGLRSLLVSGKICILHLKAPFSF